MTFDPFDTITPAPPNPFLPPEPAARTVIAWASGQTASAAMRTDDGWWLVTGEEEPWTWEELVGRFVDERDPIWGRIGVATQWEPVNERHPLPDPDPDHDTD